MASAKRTSGKVLEWRARKLHRGAQDLLEMVPQLYPGFEIPWHLAPAAEAFAKIPFGPQRILLSCGPRMGKSTLISSFIAWLQLLRPCRVMLVSYGSDLSESWSREIQDSFVRAGGQLHPNKQSAAFWETREGGSVRAMGLGGPATGAGADVLIFDDVYAGRAAAESETVRDHTSAEVRGKFLTRVEPNGAVVLCQVRWHTHDIFAELEAEGGWQTINIDCLDAAGQSIWPSRWSTEALRIKEKELGQYDWNAQYRGRPVPPGGAVFSGEPARFDWPEHHRGQTLLVCDPAATANARADYSVIMVAQGYRQEETDLPILDVLDVWRRQCEIPQLVEVLAHYSDHWNCPVAIESVGGFAAVPQMLRKIRPNLRIYPTKPKGDKLVRSLPAAAAWADQRIRIPTGKGHKAEWMPAFLREVQSFTGIGDKHDDQIDCLSAAYELATGPMTRPNRGRWILPRPALGLPF